MAQEPKYEKILALIEGHIDKLSFFENPVSLATDKLLSLLNYRFFEEYNALVPEERRCSLEKSNKFGYLLNHAFYDRNSYELEEDPGDVISYLDDTSSMSNIGYNLNMPYWYNGGEFKALRLETFSFYEGCLDGEEDSEGNAIDDVSELSAIDLFSMLSQLDNRYVDAEAVCENAEFCSWLKEGLVWGCGDNLMSLILLPSTIKKTISKANKKHKKILEKAFNIIHCYDNYNDQYNGIASSTYNIGNGANGKDFIVFWNGADDYYTSNGATADPRLYFCLLYLDWYYLSLNMGV